MSTATIEERMAKYQAAEWITRFRASGVPEKFLTDWFATWKSSTPEQSAAHQRACEAYDRKLSAIILGGYGVGKTHLLTAAVKSAIIGKRVAGYYTMSGLLREWRDSFSKGASEGSWFARLVDKDLICVDEFNIRLNTDAESRFIQELFDSRYLNRRPIWIAANISSKEMAVILGDRILDRLKDMGAMKITMDWESHRRRP